MISQDDWSNGCWKFTIFIYLNIKKKWGKKWGKLHHITACTKKHHVINTYFWFIMATIIHHLMQLSIYDMFCESWIAVAEPWCKTYHIAIVCCILHNLALRTGSQILNLYNSFNKSVLKQHLVCKYIHHYQRAECIL